jgi:glutathione S-transferase
MNIEAHLPDTGALILARPSRRARRRARLVDMWSGLLQAARRPAAVWRLHRGRRLLCPRVCMRLQTYALPVPPAIAAYVERVCALPGVKAWIDEALAEKDFLDFEEPYRLAPHVPPLRGSLP